MESHDPDLTVLARNRVFIFPIVDLCIPVLDANFKLEDAWR